MHNLFYFANFIQSHSNWRYLLRLWLPVDRPFSDWGPSTGRSVESRTSVRRRASPWKRDARIWASRCVGWSRSATTATATTPRHTASTRSHWGSSAVATRKTDNPVPCRGKNMDRCCADHTRRSEARSTPVSWDSPGTRNWSLGSGSYTQTCLDDETMLNIN